MISQAFQSSDSILKGSPLMISSGGGRTLLDVIQVSHLTPARITDHLPISWAMKAPPTIPVSGAHVIAPTTRPTVPPTIALKRPISITLLVDVPLFPEHGTWFSHQKSLVIPVLVVTNQVSSHSSDIDSKTSCCDYQY